MSSKSPVVEPIPAKIDDDPSAPRRSRSSSTPAKTRLANDRHLRRGLPYVKFGRCVFYLRSDVIAYLAAHRVDPAQGRGSGEVPSRCAPLRFGQLVSVGVLTPSDPFLKR